MGMNSLDFDLMFVSAIKGNIETIRNLVDKGANVNVQDSDGMTPLMMLITWQKFSIEHLKCYIELGADLNIANREGLTLFLYLASDKTLSPEIIKVLVQNGADINARDTQGNTPLMVSAQCGTLTSELLRAFVECGANVNARDDNGRTAMMKTMWVISDKVSCTLIETFAECGSDINARDNNGMTALGWSIYNNKIDKEMLKTFLRLGADTEDFDRKSEAGKSSVLDIQRLQPILVKILIENLEITPEWVIDFIKKTLGERMESWLENGVAGMEELLAKVASRLGEIPKDRNGEFVVMEF